MIGGIGLFGKVHRSNRGYYVATQFFHVCFMPLFPIQSYVVTERGFLKFKGVKIPMYRLSRNVAYLRGVFTLGLLGGIPKLFWLIPPGQDTSTLGPDDALFINVAFTFAIVSLVGMIATFSHPRIRQASTEVSDQMEGFIDSKLSPNQPMHSDGAANAAPPVMAGR